MEKPFLKPKEKEDLILMKQLKLSDPIWYFVEQSLQQDEVCKINKIRWSSYEAFEFLFI